MSSRRPVVALTACKLLLLLLLLQVLERKGLHQVPSVFCLKEVFQVSQSDTAVSLSAPKFASLAAASHYSSRCKPAGNVE